MPDIFAFSPADCFHVREPNLRRPYRSISFESVASRRIETKGDRNLPITGTNQLICTTRTKRNLIYLGSGQILGTTRAKSREHRSKRRSRHGGCVQSKNEFDKNHRRRIERRDYRPDLSFDYRVSLDIARKKRATTPRILFNLLSRTYTRSAGLKKATGSGNYLISWVIPTLYAKPYPLWVVGPW